MNAAPPSPLSVERSCQDWILCSDLEEKLSPSGLQTLFSSPRWEPDPAPLRLEEPGRPPELRVAGRSARTPKPGALRDARARAHLIHTFLHHELQAAELFAWAILAFPETPQAFRSGLLGLCRSELEHLALYREHLGHLGFQVGDFPVRDWFWERVRGSASPGAFVSLVGLGLEGANLEHSARFASAFRSAGDERGAVILERVEEEEVAHVAFAASWFERLTGKPLTFENWSATLPAPITPAVLRGKPLNERARKRAGLDADFLSKLANVPPPEGSTEATR